MHGYDLHGGGPHPPPSHEHMGSAPQPPHHDMLHPDSTDSYVTYLESDDDSLQQDASSP